jgi:ABC-type sugar transport systems, permease components
MKTNSLVFPKKIFLFAIPALLSYIIFWVFPIFQLFGYSVTDYNGLSRVFNFVGLSNYRTILTEGDLFNSIRNTLIYTVILMIFGNLIALILALALNAKIRAKGFYRTAAYLPTLFSAIVVGFIWSYVYEPDTGMIASILNVLHLNGGAGFNILGYYSSALYGIIIVDIWKNIGTTMIIYLAGLQTIDASLLEAGRIDGCNDWQLTHRIKLPLLFPSITINVIFSVINGLKAFDYPFIMTNGGPGKATNTLMYTIYQIAFTDQQFGKASAFSVCAFVLIIAITSVMIAFMNRKEVSL